MSSSLRDIFRRRSKPMDERPPDELVRRVRSQSGRYPMDERLPDGTPAMQMGIPEWQRRQLGLGSAEAQPAPQAGGSFKDRLKQTMGHPPLGAQPPRPAGVPAGAHWDATGANPDGGEWIAPANSPTGSFEPQQQQQVTDLGKGSTFTEGGTGATRDRRTQPRDYIADDEAYARDLEKHKGPFWKRLAAASIRAGQAASHQDISPILTDTEQKLADARARLGTDVATAKAKSQIEQGEMTPFQLPDGTWTVAPKRSVGSVLSRQQNQQANLSLRRKTAEDHNKRWDTMGKHEAARDAQALYNSGAADDDEDLRDEIVRRMGLPEGTRLPPHTQGQIRTDENGNFIVINPRSNTAAPVTQRTEGGRARTVGSMQGTVETNKQNRFNVNQDRLRNPPAKPTRAAKPDNTALRRAAALTGTIEETRKELESFDSRNLGTRTPEIERRRKAIADKAASAMTELNNLNAGYEAGIGTGGYPYYKQKEGGALSDLDQPIYGTPKGRAGEDPKVRAYANKFFGGDYNKAQAEIKAQRGQ